MEKDNKISNIPEEIYLDNELIENNTEIERESFIRDDYYVHSFFYEGAQNAINEINLIYSDDINERDFALNLLRKIFGNIVKEPENEKFSRIKLSNKIIQKIINFPSVYDLMIAIGFKRKLYENEDHLILIEYNREIFCTIYFFILLLTTNYEENQYNLDENKYRYNFNENESDNYHNNNKMREFMMETSGIRTKNIIEEIVKKEKNDNNKYVRPSEKMRNLLMETAHIRQNQNNINNDNSNNYNNISTQNLQNLNLNNNNISNFNNNNRNNKSSLAVPPKNLTYSNLINTGTKENTY
jgi:hypothetical protein